MYVLSELTDPVNLIVVACVAHIQFAFLITKPPTPKVKLVEATANFTGIEFE